MRILLLAAAFLAPGCEAKQQGSDQRNILKPAVFDAGLAVARATASPNRHCTLVGADGNPFDLMISGDAAYRETDPAGRWQIIEPENWSAKNVSSQFDMGLGGVSTHSWKISEGIMSARLEWCDDCPLDGTDSTITVHDYAGRAFAGVCRDLKEKISDS